MTRHGIELDSEAVRAFCRKWKIKELSVFGSILRDDFRADSDVDFLADYEEDAEWDLFDHMDMEEELAGIIGRNADLIERSVVEKSENYIRRKYILSNAEAVI